MWEVRVYMQTSCCHLECYMVHLHTLDVLLSCPCFIANTPVQCRNLREGWRSRMDFTKERGGDSTCAWQTDPN